MWAESPARLYGLAAEALIAQIVEAEERPPEARVKVELQGDDPGDLLVHWLNTVLLHHELERAVWTRARVELPEPGSLVATLEGSRLDPARDVRLREVKAVSHHFLALELAPPHCRCRLVLDI